MIDALIIGGDSMIGSALCLELEANGLVVAATSRRIDRRSTDIFLDLAQPDTDWPILPQARFWILAAAIPKLATCRKNSEASYRINVIAVERLAKKAAAQGAQIIFLSSDKIFDGSRPHRIANDKPCPLSEYGRQKALAEEIVLSTSQNNLVIRLTKVLSPVDKLFNFWQDALKRNEPITALMDMTFAPLSVETVVAGIHRTFTQKISGILQFSGPEDITYVIAAQHFANLLGAQLKNITPVSSINFGIPVEERPPFTSLNTERAESTLKLQFDTLTKLLNQTFSDH